mmetsp:Transcript_5877/g.24733  ORF Transcript_5877/g.24733 Transcript_5877/m.24733 type:complete len:376 (-) Transcript_5877:795-1922(-)
MGHPALTSPFAAAHKAACRRAATRAANATQGRPPAAAAESESAVWRACAEAATRAGGSTAGCEHNSDRAVSPATLTARGWATNSYRPDTRSSLRHESNASAASALPAAQASIRGVHPLLSRADGSAPASSRQATTPAGRLGGATSRKIGSGESADESASGAALAASAARCGITAGAPAPDAARAPLPPHRRASACASRELAAPLGTKADLIARSPASAVAASASSARASRSRRLRRATARDRTAACSTEMAAGKARKPRSMASLASVHASDVAALTALMSHHASGCSDGSSCRAAGAGMSSRRPAPPLGASLPRFPPAASRLVHWACSAGASAASPAECPDSPSALLAAGDVLPASRRLRSASNAACAVCEAMSL